MHELCLSVQVLKSVQALQYLIQCRYGFVRYFTKDKAEEAKSTLNGTKLDGTESMVGHSEVFELWFE